MDYNNRRFQFKVDNTDVNAYSKHFFNSLLSWKSEEHQYQTYIFFGNINLVFRNIKIKKYMLSKFIFNHILKKDYKLMFLLK